MTKDEDFKLLKIQSVVLKVNQHCDGCREKVKKILQRIEGVYQVIIDAEQQKVTVLGTVDSATLIKKLERAGKYAHLWSPKSNQNQKQKATSIKDENNNNNKNKGQNPNAVKNQNLEPLKNKQELPLMPVEDYCFDEEDEEEPDEEEMQQLIMKAMLKQQAEANAKKANNDGAILNGNNGNPGKKGGQSPVGIDPKALAAMRMSSSGDINSMMDLAGFHGNGISNAGGGFPASGMTAMHNPAAVMMMNTGGYQQGNNPAAMMMNNMHNRQPQMMYSRSPLVPPTTGYYYGYGAVQVPAVPYSYSEYGYGGESSGTHMFSDENTGSCSVM